MKNVALAAALTLFTMPLFAARELTITTVETAMPGAEGADKKKSEPERHTLHVTIGRDYARSVDGDHQVIYDFGKRRLIYADLAQKTYHDYSLFAELTGRRVELENRIYQSKALAAGQADAPMMDLIVSEQELSLLAGPDSAQPVVKDTPRERRYMASAKEGAIELFAASKEMLPMTAAERDGFIRFFRYTFGGHPAALTALGKLDGIPKSYRAAGLGHFVTIDITESKSVPDAPYSLGDAKETFDDDLIAAGMRAARTTPESREAAAKKLVADAVALADAKKPLQAMLSFLEVNLTVGGDLPPEFAPKRAALTASPDVNALVSSLRPQSEAEAKAAVATFGRLMSAAGDKAYVLRIFRGDMEASLGQANEAIEDFRAALTVNPTITGVWKDLGESYINNYENLIGWKCFEIARKLRPEHPLLANISKIEEGLLKDHPEYF